MTETASRTGRAELDDADDVRVSCVLEVLGGESVSAVARRAGVEPAVVHRWVRLFTEAGSARLANRPEPTLARQRDRFLAAFAHELRTPLAVARGWAAMLDDDELPAEMTAATVSKLCQALESVAERTQEVEYLAAASLGRLRVERRAVPVVDLVPGDRVIPSGDVTAVVHTDRELAARVVRDLWDAAGMAPTPRARRLEVRTRHPWVELRLVREAEPIDPRVLQALFDPFDANDDDTGVTTGLYLARALSVALGGTLGLEQDDDAAVFWLRLPLNPTLRSLR